MEEERGAGRGCVGMSQGLAPRREGAVVDYAGGHRGAAVIHAAVPACTIDIDHRGVSAGGEGQRRFSHAGNGRGRMSRTTPTGRRVGRRFAQRTEPVASPGVRSPSRRPKPAYAPPRRPGCGGQNANRHGRNQWSIEPSSPRPPRSSRLTERPIASFPAPRMTSTPPRSTRASRARLGDIQIRPDALERVRL